MTGTGSLRRRLERLELRPPETGDVLAALRTFRDTGHVPEGRPRVVELVERVVAFGRAVRERRREEPSSGP